MLCIEARSSLTWRGPLTSNCLNYFNTEQAQALLDYFVRGAPQRQSQLVRDAATVHSQDAPISIDYGN